MSARFHLARHCVPVALAVASGVLVIAGCGSSSKPSSASQSASNLASAGIRFSSCMRAHGVSHFPDPTSSGGGVRISINSNSGINPASPAFQAAQKACAKLLPGGAPGSGPPASAATMKQMLAVAECMRAHGVSGFPDPTSRLPSIPGTGAVLFHNGAGFVIPSTIDTQSPAFEQAATACNLTPGGGKGGGGKVKTI